MYNGSSCSYLDVSETVFPDLYMVTQPWHLPMSLSAGLLQGHQSLLVAWQLWILSSCYTHPAGVETGQNFLLSCNK